MIVFWNTNIFYDFVKKGLAEGNDLGSTARYIEERKSIAAHAFYLAADEQYPYYSWGSSFAWGHWIEFFAGEDQKVQVLETNGFVNALPKSAFSLFLSQRLWQESGETLIAAYPHLKMYHIKPDGSLIAIEVN